MVPEEFTFEQLKKRSGAVELERLRQLSRHLGTYLSGTHKETRLDRAVGPKLAKRTILDDATHAQHQGKLFTRFQKAWNGLTEQQARERLRFVTILHTVCAVETKAILHAVEEMEEQLRSAFSQEIAQIGILGVTEIEIVNLGLYGKQDTEDESRKGEVLRKLARTAGITVTDMEHLAFVHFHGILDLGPNAAIMEKKLHTVLRQTWQVPWGVKLGRLHTDKSIKKNLSKLAGYVTKGGNKDLRYQKRFGYESPEALELAMKKQGYAKREEQDDHLGLSIWEVSVLVHVYDALMRRNSARDGYLFLGGTVVLSRYQTRHGFRIWKSALGNTPFWKSHVATSIRRIG